MSTIINSLLIFKKRNWPVFTPSYTESETNTLRHWNTELLSSRASLTSWGEGASLALVGDPSSDGGMIMPYGVDVLHRPA